MNATPAKSHGRATTLEAIRGILLAIFLLGALGTGAELYLIEHTEDRWQWIPLLLLALSLVSLLAHAVFRRAATVRIFQLTMILFVISGFVGFWLHYQAKMEFKLETNPDLAGLELFWEAIKGAAVPPVLAPGMMIQMGLLGLAWTFRHPALGASAEKNEPTNTGE